MNPIFVTFWMFVTSIRERKKHIREEHSMDQYLLIFAVGVEWWG